MSSPKRFEWVKMNLDTGAAMNFGPDGAGDGRIYRAAPLRVPATLVVAERPSTCQDSHLTGKPGASQGSPLRVAPVVPQGMGGDPTALPLAATRSS